MSETREFGEWIGRSSEAEDLVTAELVARYRAILDPHLAPAPDDAAPLCLHWCLSPAVAPMAELGRDGHPALNRNLPPVPNPRRMWAGGEIETHDWLRVGDTVRRVSTIADVSKKTGRTGELWFVAVNHDYLTPRGLAIRERQDLVYREEARPDAPAPASAAAAPTARTSQRRWDVEPGPVMLFRYSAITFNGHRIHYDLPYATGVEGYAGLVVHGPIQATLLMNLAAVAEGRPPRRFRYRGVAPAIAERPLGVCAGGKGRYWTEGLDGTVHMEAEILED
jgi:3-methylfumaryl-CoA hydratase